MLDLSIIIVNWNAKGFLLECLESVIEETSRYQTEIIVVDNASSDGSPQAVIEKFPNVILIRENRNLGFARGNNIGIRQSKGRYVALINPDVRLLKGCIERLCAYMDQHPNVGMVGPKILNSDLTLQATNRKIPTIWNSFCNSLALYRLFPRSRFFSGQYTTYSNHEEILKAEVLSGCFWVVRREALSEVGLLDEDFFMYGEDLDWCKRFHESGWNVIYYPGAQAVHHGGASSSNAPVRFYVEKQRANIRYWNKHHSSSATICYVLTMWLYHAVRIIGHISQRVVRPSKRVETSHKIRRGYAVIKWLFRN